jgi:glycosyltransferase involved in cell wall biosynthesis
MANSEPLTSVLFVVPGDPEQKTGGYRYVQRVVAGLRDNGVDAVIAGLRGRFPVPDRMAGASMDSMLKDLPDDSVVVLDGLAMGGLPDVVAKHASRLRIVSLVHHALADETGLTQELLDWLFQVERRALSKVAGVITTSGHTAQRLKDYDVPATAIRVVEPGADTIAGTGNETPPLRAPGRTINLLCVAHLSPRKAQHHLVEALSDLRDFSWHCTLAGSLDRDENYTHKLRGIITNLGLEHRVSLVGELDDTELASAYREADAFVLPSVYEGYGMVIDEAIAAGLPVITTDGGALSSTGHRPGIRQYPAGDVAELRDCLKDWLADPGALGEAATQALETARSLRSWQSTSVAFQRALEDLLPPPAPATFDSGWLALREPADHLARNRRLLSELLAWAEQDYCHPGALSGHYAPPLLVVDLGSGTGSNARYLVPAMTVPQRWVLLDQDEHLLALAGESLKHLDIQLDTHACHLSAVRLGGQIPDGTRLITASALIDLMSEDWLEALAIAAARHDASVFIVLSYAGEFELSPADQDDDWIRKTVNHHQHNDKGTGAALGPLATSYLKQQLELREYQVSVAASPWQLTPGQSELQRVLLRGWRDAVMQQSPDERQRAERWFALRLKQADEQRLAIRVDHQDLFGRPASAGIA